MTGSPRGSSKVYLYGINSHLRQYYEECLNVLYGGKKEQTSKAVFAGSDSRGKAGCQCLYPT